MLRTLERVIERILYSSRWLLVPFYVGLSLLLLVMTVSFVKEMVHVASHVMEAKETDVILAALTLIDLVLVASLIVMVMISGYENFVSRIEIGDNDEKLSWLGKLDSGTLKLKVSSSIVAISSIHLLKAFMNANNIDNEKLGWLMALHMTFVASALLMGVLEKKILGQKGGD